MVYQAKDGVIEESRMKYNDAYIQLGIETIRKKSSAATSRNPKPKPRLADAKHSNEWEFKARQFGMLARGRVRRKTRFTSCNPQRVHNGDTHSYLVATKAKSLSTSGYSVIDP